MKLLKTYQHELLSQRDTQMWLIQSQLRASSCTRSGSWINLIRFTQSRLGSISFGGIRGGGLHIFGEVLPYQWTGSKYYFPLYERKIRSQDSIFQKLWNIFQKLISMQKNHSTQKSILVFSAIFCLEMKIVNFFPKDCKTFCQILWLNIKDIYYLRIDKVIIH